MFSKFKKIYVSQVDEIDCGVAALNMILKNWGSSYPLAYLRELAKTTSEGTTALGIVEAANKLGLNTQAIMADRTLFNDNLNTPFIVHIIKKDGLHHYYTVFDIKNDKIVIGDPNPKKKIISMEWEDFFEEWDGIAIFFSTGQKYQKYKEKEGNLFQFLPMIKKHKKLILTISSISILFALISVVGSYFLQFSLDYFIPKEDINFLSILALSLILAYLFQAFLSYGRGVLVTIFGQKISAEITLNYIQYLLLLPMSFFSTRKTGEIISRFNDSNKIVDALGNSVLSIFLDFWSTIIIGICLFIQNSKLFTLSLVSLPIYLIIVLSFERKFDKMNQDTMQKNADLNSAIIDSLKGIETIKVMSAEEGQFTSIKEKLKKFLDKSLSFNKTNELQVSLKTGLQSILTIIILWSGSKLVISQEITIGQLMTYNALLTFFITPLQNILNLQPKLQTATVANRRLNEIYAVEPEFSNDRLVDDYQKIHGDISVENLSFRYGYGPDILSEITFNIPFGSKLAIVGMSGSGKTTLAKLLVGFFEIETNEGSVSINDININKIAKRTLRDYIVYVPQEPQIFSGTIEENLRFGSAKSSSRNDLDEATNNAQIFEDIERLPLGYQTNIGENGDFMSEGQKQRLTIARALLSPASVLIFDETTSNLDAITEEKIISYLLKIKDRTIIFIAHRLPIAKKTNNIFVIDHGSLVEHGSHKDLLKERGYYYKLTQARG